MKPIQSRKKTPGKRGRVSLGKAVFLEAKDIAESKASGINITTEDIVRGAILCALIIFTAMMQTTFFSRFAPFGSTPDMMLSLTVAVAISEGEKWGSVCGLICAFFIDSLGGLTFGLSLLPLLYAAAGCTVGILSKYYLSNTVVTKACYIGASSAARAIFTTITAKSVCGTTLSRILVDIVIPEFFSTAVIAPLVYVVVWLSYKHFHKSRAERTE